MSETNSSPEIEKQSAWTLTRAVTAAAIVLIALILGLFVLALIVALSNAEGAASFMTYVKDILVIVAVMQLILIVTALAVFIIQLARFFNLLYHEVKPMTEETKATLATMRQTTEFIAKRGTEPIIQAQSFMAGLIAFLREIFRFGRLFK